MADWISFFDKDHPIYVNDRHRRVHARLIALGIEPYIATPEAVVIDYGCGEAFHAGRIAERAGRLILCEAAPQLRQSLHRRFAENDRIAVLSPGEVAALPDASADLIVLHSVAQYLTPPETDDLLRLFRRLLRGGGALVVGDVVRPDVSAVTDAFALLGLAAANGFFFAALFGLVRTALSDYRRLRRSAGLTRYGEDEMIAKLKAAGFSARRAEHNIGHNQMRMAFVARPA